MMSRERQLQLVKRSLALKHKLRVFDNIQAPSTHEEIAQHLAVQWELEDELKAITDILALVRESNKNRYKERYFNNEISTRRKGISA